MKYPGDVSRIYTDGDVDSYLRNHQPISTSHDAPAPKHLSWRTSPWGPEPLLPTTLLSMWPPQLASDHQNVNAVVDDLVSYGQQGIVRSGPN